MAGLNGKSDIIENVENSTTSKIPPRLFAYILLVKNISHAQIFSPIAYYYHNFNSVSEIDSKFEFLK